MEAQLKSKIQPLLHSSLISLSRLSSPLLSLSTLCCSLLFGASLFYVSTAWSQTDTTEPIEISQGPMLNRGDWEISGEGSYFKSNEGNYREISFSPKMEYFFLNRFSAGAKLLYEDTSRISPSVSIGPSLTWYFGLINSTGFYVDQSVLYVTPSGSIDNYFAGQTGVGIDYFINPSVAFGPSLRGIYYFSGDMQKPDGGLELRFALSIFI